MIVKLDRVMLKLKIVVGLIFSVLSLWILCPELIIGSLRDNPVKQFLAVIVLFWLLLSIVHLIDGIVNLKGHGKLLELDDNSLTTMAKHLDGKLLTFLYPRLNLSRKLGQHGWRILDALRQ